MMNDCLVISLTASDNKCTHLTGDKESILLAETIVVGPGENDGARGAV